MLELWSEKDENENKIGSYFKKLTKNILELTSDLISKITSSHIFLF